MENAKCLRKGPMIICIILLIISFTVSCSKSGDKTITAPDDNSDVRLTGSLSESVPVDLAVVSITETVSDKVMDSITLAIKSLRADPPGPGDVNDYSTKVEKMKRVLAATDKYDCMEAIPYEFNLSQGIFGHSRCSSAAQVAINPHPDGGGSWMSGAGDLGLWWDYAEPDEESGLACSASVINNAMTSVAAYSDSALGMHAMAACAGRIDGWGRPADIGGSLNLLSSISGINTTTKAFTVTKATVTREADTADGLQVFVTTLEGTLTDVPRSITSPYRLRVRHVPTNDDNTTYFGVVQFEIDKLEDGMYPGIISISYASDGDGINYRYRQARAPSTPSSGFDTSTYEIRDDIESSMTEVIVDNDANGFGKLILAWTAGGTMVFNAETKDDGTGYAFFGNAPMSSAGTDDYYTIHGMKCNMNIVETYIQMQILTLEASTGIWELATDGSKIKYAPTNSCDCDSGDGTFAVTNQDDPSIDESLACPFINELESKSTYDGSWTAPTAPSNSF